MVLYGQVDFDFVSKKLCLFSPEIFYGKEIFPIYPLTKGVSSKQISRAVANALKAGFALEDSLPEEIIKKFNLPQINEAIRMLHFPKSRTEFELAKKRLNFTNLLRFVLANLSQRDKNQKSQTNKISWPQKEIDDFISSLPFKLTVDQDKAVEDIAKDLTSSHPMSRLIQGDVGSGKTIVGLIASLAVARGGYRTVWLAPTEILSNQHFETAKRFFATSDFAIELVTSQTKRKNKDINYSADLIIGTHAVLQKDVIIDKLGLVIVDEQHRFGVKQRSLLVKGNSQQPHFLSFSATPIPRTLSHVIFGNLDISVIKSKPPGRIQAKTYAVPPEKRDDTYKFIDSLIQLGQQAFIVCPLIEQSQTKGEAIGELFDIVDDRKTVDDEVENIAKTILGARRIAKIHGKMKPQEKEEIMMRMNAGEIDVLVATSVIEVGVDIPRASVIIIEDADRFGLSQLHQFRGRVGRNNMQSYCFLFSTKMQEEKTRERLAAFVRHNDGFELSSIDLKQRGPGAILGLTQSGFGKFNPLWFEDTKLLDEVVNLAKDVLPNLSKMSLLSKEVDSQFVTDHLE
jgi:ATP-dependent DNA helicase RecG